MMAHKTLTISEEAYERLLKAKKDERESFTEVIIRLTSGRTNLLNHAGSWADLKDENVENVFAEIREAWKGWKRRP